MSGLVEEIFELALDLPMPSGGKHSSDCPWVTGEGSVLCECGWNDHCDGARETRKQMLEKIQAFRAQPELTEDQIHTRYNVLAFIFGKHHINDPAYLNNLNDLRAAALRPFGVK